MTYASVYGFTGAQVGQLPCLTGDHRVLTNTGWKFIGAVTKADKVLSFNVATHNQEWKAVLDTIKHAVDPTADADRCIRMQSSGMDVIATRDHRMLLARSAQSATLRTRSATRLSASC